MEQHLRKSQEERREEIVQAVVELAAEQDVKDVTTQAIADRLGIAQPSIFRHFPNREAIFLMTIGWISEGLFAVLEKVFASDLPSDERLHRLLNRQLEFISRNQGIPRILFSERVHAESSNLRARVITVMERYERQVAALLTAGIESGRFREDLDAQETARLIMAMIQGLMMRWSLSNFSFSLEEQGEALWRLLWSSLAPRAGGPGPRTTS